MTHVPGSDTPPRHIDCVDCGGRCHLLSHELGEPVEPGEIVAYRCEDCRDRWDLVWLDPDIDTDDGGERG